MKYNVEDVVGAMFNVASRPELQQGVDGLIAITISAEIVSRYEGTYSR